jgi:DNA-directed RNA polymerase subunit M/transcription elongation factor TFIIS
MTDLVSEKENLIVLDLQELHSINNSLINYKQHPESTIISHLTALQQVSISKSDLDSTLIHRSISLLAKLNAPSTKIQEIRFLAKKVRDSWQKQLTQNSPSKSLQTQNPPKPKTPANLNPNPPTPLSPLPDLYHPNRNRGLHSLHQIFSDPTLSKSVLKKDPEFILTPKILLHKVITIEHDIFVKCNQNMTNYVEKIRGKIMQ